MKTMVLILLTMAGLAACNNGAQPAAPSTKAVDSAAAAAPDTIKAISPDSLKR
ncbi:MAG TPA: hypothetical protein VMH27_05295 [Puia sp.]|nr:hypothetical protein [Puia sp.]